ncbi:MAG: class I SAM-dependent methyltransferase [Treponema sp.]|jgi:23S rRNA G2069 N7-methylase RlmK/C1962 C5-methylase RlmI|nr:class I SAM-dependent methyltransferase [Treponema sp.]
MTRTFTMQDEEKNAAQAEMLGNRLAKRSRHLKKWARRTGVEVFRLYDRDIPEIPLVLDYYAGAISGALYERPYEKDEEEEQHWLAAMTEAVSASLDIPRDRIFLKQRRRQRGKAQYQKQGERQLIREIREGGLRFRVNLSDYLDTGFFPDRRKMRSLVGKEAAGRGVLNLFCYTASFSVYAAAGGAARVDSVDLSNTYLDWGAVNFDLNGFRAERLNSGDFFRFHGSSEGSGQARPDIEAGPLGGKGPPPHRLIRGDVLPFLDAAATARLSWDIIILDPPAFSNSKKMSGALDLRRDHRELICRCLALLNPGGKLWFSANPRHFKLFPEDFPGAVIEDMGPLIIDEDFQGRKIPLCFTFRV